MPAGQPKSYKTLKQLKLKLSDYWVWIEMKNKVPTKQNLRLFLEISDETLKSYAREGNEYSATIKDAFAQIEDYWLESLNRNKQATGSIFYLKNAYHYRDKHETDITSGGKPLPISVTFTDTPQEEE